MLQTRQLVALLLLLSATSACSPAPTPSPTPSVTIEQAADAYRSFTATWSATHSDVLNAAAAAADVDPAMVAAYATAIADSYTAFADGVRAIEVPGSVLPAKQAELETLTAVVGLAKQLEAEPANITVKTELQGALARVAQTSANIEALLGISN